MAFYVMSDIHGCYDEFMKMMETIGFTDSDALILGGDYIDRGKQSYEMLQWLMNDRPEHCVTVRGNHEEEFIANVDVLLSIDDNRPLLEICEMLHETSEYFDLYGTIRGLIREHGATMDDLIRWRKMFDIMPLHYPRKVGSKRYDIVHAGHILTQTAEENGIDRKEFALYARDEAYTLGGIKRHTVICGHTPTIVKGQFCYNHGDVFRYEDKERGCVFYNIDCGCVFRKKEPEAKLACIRLEDEKIFYV